MRLEDRPARHPVHRVKNNPVPARAAGEWDKRHGDHDTYTQFLLDVLSYSDPARCSKAQKYTYYGNRPVLVHTVSHDHAGQIEVRAALWHQ